MLGVVQQVVDDGQVFEIAQDYAKNIITCAPACVLCTQPLYTQRLCTQQPRHAAMM